VFFQQLFHPHFSHCHATHGEDTVLPVDHGAGTTSFDAVTELQLPALGTAFCIEAAQLMGMGPD